MSLRLLSYLASLGFRSDLDAGAAQDGAVDCVARDETSEPAPADDHSQLKFVLAL